MDFVKRMLKRASESEVGSRDQYFFESAALTSIRAMISIWADDHHRGEPLKGHDRVRWVKEVYGRLQELDKILNQREDKK